MEKAAKNSREQKELVSLLIKNELAFAKLYSIYAAVLPEREFWLKLSSEEKEHALWLKALYESRDICEVRWRILQKETIIQLINDIESEQTRAVSNEKIVSVLERVLRYERVFIEKDFFEIFAASSPKLSQIRSKLKDETEHHIRSIENKIRQMQK